MRLVGPDRLHELLGSTVHAQVHDLEAGPFQHDDHEVLTDIVDVALHRADHVLADRLRAGLGDQWPQDNQRALHRPGRDQHLGDEEIASLEAAADLFQRRDQCLEEDVHGVHPQLEGLFGECLDLGGVPIERVIEQLLPDFFLATHV